MQICMWFQTVTPDVTLAFCNSQQPKEDPPKSALTLDVPKNAVLCQQTWPPRHILEIISCVWQIPEGKLILLR